MRRVSQSQAVAALLVSGLLIAFSQTVPVQAQGMWNPKSWFGSPASEASAAQKQADEAQAAADRAQAEADKARERAELARQAAQQAGAEKHPRVTQTATESTAPAEASTPSPKPGSMPNFTEEAANTKESSGWDLMNVFKRGHQEEPKAEATTITKTEPVKAAEKPEDATKNRTLFNLFSRPENPNTTASAENTTPSVAPVVDPSIKTKAALIETEKGNIAIEFYPDEAPQTVKNFVKLVDEGFYNKFNMKFHRVIPGFVVQTGDPTGTGAGGSKDRVPLEAKNKLSHNAKGVVAMARGAGPDSASSQFYITLAPQTSLDGKYAIFGRVLSGLDVLDKIEKGDMLYGIRLVELSSVTPDLPVEKKGLFSKLF